MSRETNSTRDRTILDPIGLDPAAISRFVAILSVDKTRDALGDYIFVSAPCLMTPFECISLETRLRVEFS